MFWLALAHIFILFDSVIHLNMSSHIPCILAVSIYCWIIQRGQWQKKWKKMTRLVFFLPLSCYWCLLFFFYFFSVVCCWIRFLELSTQNEWPREMHFFVGNSEVCVCVCATLIEYEMRTRKKHWYTWLYRNVSHQIPAQIRDQRIFYTRLGYLRMTRTMNMHFE